MIRYIPAAMMLGRSLLVTLLYVQGISSITGDDKLALLEKRVESLETALASLEARYGLTRHCLPPSLPHGEAVCQEKLLPGAKCFATCNPGYISTPGKDTTVCMEDGGWSEQLACEIPLVLVSGGVVSDKTVFQGDVSDNTVFHGDVPNNTVFQGNVSEYESIDSSLELLSLYPSTGCNITIPDLLSPRHLHSLVYVPPEQVLACNGVSSEYEATCEAWNTTNNTWYHHSYPNKGTKNTEDICDKDRHHYYGTMCRRNKDRKKGRYAAESLHVAGRTMVIGGMLFDKKGHEPADSVRELRPGGGGHGIYWADQYSNINLEKKRSFFCAVPLKESGFLAVGGLSHGENIEKSSEFWGLGYSELSDNIEDVADMSTPRYGHGCSAVPGEDLSVLVSGGITGRGKTATHSAEIFDWSSNSWRNISDMKTPRFGHAVVTVGDKIFAIGGDTKDRGDIIDTIEEYDVKANAWKIIKKTLKIPRTNFGVTLVPHSIFTGCSVKQAEDN